MGGGYPDILTALAQGGMMPPQPSPIMNQAPMANGVQPMMAAPDAAFGNPATLSNRIQQWLGAKPEDQGGQIQDILAGRFQPEPTMNDVGNAALATLNNRQYVPAQQEANARLGGGIDLMTKLAQMQETEARGNMYNAMAMNGGGRGEGLAAAMRIMSEYNNSPDVVSGKKAPMGFTDAYMMATAKQGQGITFDANGNQTVFGGAPQAQGLMKYGEKAGGAQGEADVNLRMKPQIEGATEQAKQVQEIAAEGPKEAQKEIGGAQGAAKVSLATIQAQMPQINAIVDKLSQLGKAATYTQAGIAYNAMRRQAGLSPTTAAKTRAEYMATIDNFLLPSLKATFGARVTNFDIQAAKGMMADPNLSPEEKDAQLKAFIRAKVMMVESEQRQVQNLGGSALPPDSGVSRSNPGMTLPGSTAPPDNNDPLGIR